MSISIIIVNWNTSDLCHELLKSICLFEPNTNYEIILVDNASDDFDEASFNIYPYLKIIRNTTNLKYAKANNQAIKIATGDLILFLNPDIKVTEDSISILSTYLKDHPLYMGACPKLILPNKQTDKSIRGFPYLIPLLCSYSGLDNICSKCDKYKLLRFNYQLPSDVLQPMTSALMIRADLIKKIGDFDETFPIFFNDVDFLYRTHQAKYKIRYLPDAYMYHIHGASTAKANKDLMKTESCNSLIKFYKKYFTKRYTPLGIYLISLIVNFTKPKG